MSIPNDGGQEIANAEDSTDTPSNVKENTVQNTSRDLSDSIPSEGKDTPKTDDVRKAAEFLAEAKATKSDVERREFEFDKKQVQFEATKDNSEYLMSLDESRANKIVKSLTNGEYKTRESLLQAVEQKSQVNSIGDENVQKVLTTLQEQNSLLKNELDSIRTTQVQDTDKRVLEYVYKKHPNLHPENDTDDSKWKQFRNEYDIINISDPYKRADKAYRLAFGDVDEDLEKSLGNLPSGGMAASHGKSQKLGNRAMALAKQMGFKDASIASVLKSR